MTTQTTEAPRTDRRGFPIETCRRCDGTGHYSYNPVDGTRCFGCRGKGVAYTKAAQTQVAAYMKAVEDAKWVSEFPDREFPKIINPNPPFVDPAPYVAACQSKRTRKAR